MRGPGWIRREESPRGSVFYFCYSIEIQFIITLTLREVDMARTAMIRARTEPALKSEVERILEELGMTSTEAVNLFYRQVKLQRGLPFDVKIPNKTTLETFRKTDEGRELNEYKNMKAFLKKMKKNA